MVFFFFDRARHSLLSFEVLIKENVGKYSRFSRHIPDESAMMRVSDARHA